MINQDSARLPDGKTCNDCAHFLRCHWLFNCNPLSVECDWDPPRFLHWRDERRKNERFLSPSSPPSDEQVRPGKLWGEHP